MKIKCGQCGEVFADIARAKSHGATTGHDSFEAANDDDATATATAHATNATPVDGRRRAGRGERRRDDAR